MCADVEPLLANIEPHSTTAIMAKRDGESRPKTEESPQPKKGKTLAPNRTIQMCRRKALRAYVPIQHLVARKNLQQFRKESFRRVRPQNIVGMTEQAKAICATTCQGRAGNRKRPAVFNYQARNICCSSRLELQVNEIIAQIGNRGCPLHWSSFHPSREPL